MPRPQDRLVFLNCRAHDLGYLPQQRQVILGVTPTVGTRTKGDRPESSLVAPARQRQI